MIESTTSKLKDDIPSVMQAVQHNGYGEIRKVLTLRQDIPVPRQLSPTQVLIRVYAASINPLNWKLVKGNMSLVMKLSFPNVPGSDIAGVVVDIGSKVKRLKVGDKIYGLVNESAYAEYCRADESIFALKPSNFSMIEAAAAPDSGETSYQALFTKASPPIGPGSKIFVCGGSTATGLYAIQMAKSVGAHVATTSSQRNFSLLEKLGYKLVHDNDEVKDDPKNLLVIDYNNKSFGEVLQGQNYDIVYDCVGDEQQWIKAHRILKRGGQFITIVGDDPEMNITLKAMTSMATHLASRKLGSIFSSSHHSYTMLLLQPKYQELDEMRTKYFETGKVKSLIDTVFDWKTDGVEAVYKLYEKSQSGKAQGKLILKIANEP